MVAICGGCQRSAGPSHARFTVPLLGAGIHIDATDRRLDDWPASALLWELKTSAAAQATQWSRIRGRGPASLSQDDVRIALYMAHDNADWFVGVRIDDDRIVATADRLNPSGGDCFELFFASDEVESTADMHDLVDVRARDASPAFFQIQLQPHGMVGIPAEAFSRYRTDDRWLRLASTDAARFAVSVWTQTPTQWAAELRIPMAHLPSLASSIPRDKPLRIGFDYLDYDESPAPSREQEPSYGFLPENVFSHDNNEKNVNTPRFMPQLEFGR
jgi:hypothetical protein